MVGILLLADAPLTAVAADILAAAGKTVDGQTAVIGTALAVGHPGGILQGVDLFNGQHGGLFALTALSGNKSRAESAHDACDVGTDGLAVGDPLKASEHRVVVESTALDHDVVAQLRGIGHLDDLVQSVLDDGIGQTGGDIRHSGPFLLSLLYLGIHKYGAAGTQVDGMLREQCFFCKILNAVVQGLGKVFNKGTAAGRTGLVQKNAVHGVIFDLDALHVLAADVQDAVHIRIKEGGGGVVGDGLHLALIQHKSRLDQRLAVSGGTGVGNMGGIWHLRIDFLDGADGGGQRIPLVVAVERVEQRSVFTHHRRFGGGGAGIDAQITAALVGGKIRSGHIVDTLTLQEGIILFLGGKQGLHAGNLKIDGYAGAQLLRQILQRHLGFRSGVHGGADGCEQMGIVRHDGVLRIQLQRADKGLAQLRQEVQRAAQKGNMPPDGLAAGQAGNGLVDHGLENGDCQILLGGSVVDQGLDIRLGKHAAAGGNGIDSLVVPGIFIQSRGVRLQQRGHLVDKRSCASGADAVHPLLDVSPFKIDDFRVLAAQLDGHIRLGRVVLQGRGDGDYFLDKGHLQMVGQSQSAGACDHRADGNPPQLFAGLRQKICQGLLDIGVVTSVIRKKQSILCV